MSDDAMKAHTFLWGVSRAAEPKRRMMAIPRAGAAQAAEALVKGGGVTGLTKGQFSLLDLLRALLDKTGPADVVVAAWTSGIRDAETAAWLLREGRITRLRWLVDRSFITRQPEYAEEVRRLFGDEALLESNNHAKVLLIRNSEWDVVVRSSMNLNRNARFENFDIDDSREMADFFEGCFEELVPKMGTGLGKPHEQVSMAFGCATADKAEPVKEASLLPDAGAAAWRPGT